MHRLAAAAFPAAALFRSPKDFLIGKPLGLLVGDGLEAHFQPIASLRERNFFGYEGLIRGPQGTALRCPVALFDAARDAGVNLP